MSALNRRERQLSDFLQAYIHQYGFSPTICLMKEALGYRSNSPVQNLLDRLEKQGIIEREKGSARTVRLLVRSDRPVKPEVGVFLQGTIAAGGVVEAFTDSPPEPTQIPVPFGKSDSYALKVLGDSMLGAHICSGDYVILCPVLDARSLKPGSIVAAHVAGEGTTLKHFYLKDDRVVLQPANPNFPVIEKDATLVQVQGVLVGVWREC